MIVALVPMKDHSERVPGKNYKMFNGRPLYTYILDTLSQCELVDEVAVDTDSEVIAKGIEERYKKVWILPRLPSLRGDNVPMNDVLMYDVNTIGAKVYIQTHSTNPMLSAATIDSAIKKFLEVGHIYDSLFSVTKIQARLWDWQRRPINHNVEILLNTQDLPPVYEENSCIYVFTYDSLRKRGNRIGDKPYLFLIDATEAVDIDTLLDFKVAEALHKERTIEKSTDLITPITAGTG